MMVGKKVDLSIDKKKIAEKTPLLDLDEVTVLDGEGKEALANVSFQLNSHEIVGVAGVANSGQKELCEVIAGLAKAEKGRIFFEGDNLVEKLPVISSAWGSGWDSFRKTVWAWDLSAAWTLYII